MNKPPKIHYSLKPLYSWFTKQKPPSWFQKVLTSGLSRSTGLTKVAQWLSYSTTVDVVNFFVSLALLGLGFISLVDIKHNVHFLNLTSGYILSLGLVFFGLSLVNMWSLALMKKCVPTPEKFMQKLKIKCQYVTLRNPELSEPMKQLCEHLAQGPSYFSAYQLGMALDYILINAPAHVENSSSFYQPDDTKTVALHKGGIKNLIHYKVFRNLSDVSEKMRIQKDKRTLLQKIFSSSFLKHEIIYETMVIPLFICGGLLLSYLEKDFEILLHPAVFLGVNLAFTAVGISVTRHSFLCTDEYRQNLIAKCEKILILHPESQEVVLPVLDMLQADISIQTRDNLNCILDVILTSTFDESLTVCPSFINIETIVQQEKHTEQQQRLML